MSSDIRGILICTNKYIGTLYSRYTIVPYYTSHPFQANNRNITLWFYDKTSLSLHKNVESIFDQRVLFCKYTISFALSQVPGGWASQAWTRCYNIHYLQSLIQRVNRLFRLVASFCSKRRFPHFHVYICQKKIKSKVASRFLAALLHVFFFFFNVNYVKNSVVSRLI